MLHKNFTIDDLPNEILRDIYRYWLNIKGTRLMPSYADVNSGDIIELLPYINILDVEENRYRARLVGSETVKAMNTDFTGKYLDELPFVEFILKQKYDWLVKEMRPYFNFDKLKWSSRSFMDYYSVGLPLSSNGREVDFVMIGIYYQFPKGRRIKSYNPGT